MSGRISWLLRREALLVAGVAVLAMGAAVAWYLLQASVLTVAVAPRDGTEPELIDARRGVVAASGVGIAETEAVFATTDPT